VFLEDSILLREGSFLPEVSEKIIGEGHKVEGKKGEK